MCSTWTQQEWKEFTADKSTSQGYSITAEYTNQAGETALTIADSNGNLRNVYSADGWDEELLRYDAKWHSVDIPTQQRLAAEAMFKRGFTMEALPELPALESTPDAIRELVSR